jgi:hypothetical protein
MPYKPKPNPAGLQLERARKLLDEGRNREALILALDALLHALDHLYNSLVSMQQALAPALPPYSDTQEEKPHSCFEGRLLEKKPPLFH